MTSLSSRSVSSQTWRSVLYVPADKPRAIAKAPTLAADAVILDLEDAVAPEHKETARETLAEALAQPWLVPVLIRVNATGTPWQTDDLALIHRLPIQPAGVVLPKVENVAQLENLGREWPLWAMIETPLGVLQASAVAAHPQVAGLLAGANDLAHALRTRSHAARLPLLPALCQVVLAARAYGKVPLDAVYNNVQNSAGFRAECSQGRDLGFAGKTVLHPGQIEIANQEFGVSEAEAVQARALLEVWEAARQQGQSVTTFDGHLIEQMHVDAAREALSLFRPSERV